MKIILIHEAATTMSWSARYNAASFSEAIREERGCGIGQVTVRQSDASAYRIFTGTTCASAETAEALFAAPEKPEGTALLDDVVLVSFRDTEKDLPLWLWRFMGRMQWAVGVKRQTESRRETKQRAKEFIDRLETDGQDCVLITKDLMLATIRDALYRRGYCIEGGSVRMKPLDRLRATKQTLHCGGCMHNCMLANPGCGIGKDKARLQGVREAK